MRDRNGEQLPEAPGNPERNLAMYATAYGSLYLKTANLKNEAKYDCAHAWITSTRRTIIFLFHSRLLAAPR